jgi:arsenite-transporting ATPase
MAPSRVIVFTGKGGSGASTLAAATAVAIAAAGRQTLVFGLGPGLSTSFETPPLAEPAAVAPGLEAVEGHAGRDAADEFQGWLEDLLYWRGMEPGLAEDLSALPGLNHVGRLLELEKYTQADGPEVIVVDGGPLGPFLDLPAALDAAARWLERLFSPRQQNVLEPFLRVFAGDYASTGETVFDRGRDLLGRLAGLRAVLRDPAVSSVRLVLTLDRSAVVEARQAIATLSLFSCPVDALVVNRILGSEITDAFFAPMRQEQVEVLAEIEALAPRPVLCSSLRPSAPRGAPALTAVAGEVYGQHDPAAVLHTGPVHSLVQQDGRYVLNVAVPFAQREELSLDQVDEGIAIHLNGRRCVLALPDDGYHYEAASWSFDGKVLKVVLRD